MIQCDNAEISMEAKHSDKHSESIRSKQMTGASNNL